MSLRAYLLANCTICVLHSRITFSTAIPKGELMKRYLAYRSHLSNVIQMIVDSLVDENINQKHIRMRSRLWNETIGIRTGFSKSPNRQWEIDDSMRERRLVWSPLRWVLVVFSQTQVRNGHIKRITDFDVHSLVLEVVGTNVASVYLLNSAFCCQYLH